MASDRPVKCPYCGIFFRRSAEAHVYAKGRYWHDNCYKLETGKKSQEEDDKKELLAYVEKLLDKKIDAKVQSQIKLFINNYKYTYKGIRLTLEYFFELKGNSTSKAQGGIGIVPYVYEEAKQYYIMKHQATKEIENLSGPPVTEKKVKIKDPTKHKKYSIHKIIDINGL